MKTSLPPSIELLESRIAPAGLLNVSVKAGTLVLTGGDGDESVTVAGNADGSYLLTPGANVTLHLNGADFTTPQTVEGVTKGLTASLGAGTDSLTLAAASLTGKVSVDLGAGMDSFTLNDSTLDGALTVTGDEGDDTITLGPGNLSVGGPVKFLLGGGLDTVSVTATRAAFGGIKIDGGADDDTVNLGATNSLIDIIGALTFTGGPGTNKLNVGAMGSRVAISGALSQTGADDLDSLVFDGARVTAGSLSALFAGGANELKSTATELHLTRGFTFTSGSGIETIDVAGTSVEIGGNLLVKLGDGAATAHLQPTDLLQIGGTATVVGGNAAAGVSDVKLVGATVDIFGLAKITSGVGDSNLTIFGGSALRLGHGAVIVDGPGQGNTLLGATRSLFSGGSITETHTAGAGQQQVFANTAPDSYIHGSVTLTGGTADSVELGGIVTGAITITTGPGLNLSVTVVGNGSMQVGGKVNVTVSSPDAGSSSIVLQNAIFQAAVSLRGGAGTDYIAADNCAFLGTVFADAGAGNDNLSFEFNGFSGGSLFQQAVTLRGGLGDDHFQIGGNNAATQAIVFRKLTIFDGGAGTNDKITIGTAVSFTAGPPQQLNFP